MEDIKFPCTVKALQEWLDAAAADPGNADLPITAGIPYRVEYLNRMRRDPDHWSMTELKCELLAGLVERTQMCDYNMFCYIGSNLMCPPSEVEHMLIDLERGRVDLLPSHPYRRDNN